VFVSRRASTGPGQAFPQKAWPPGQLPHDVEHKIETGDASAEYFPACPPRAHPELDSPRRADPPVDQKQARSSSCTGWFQEWHEHRSPGPVLRFYVAPLVVPGGWQTEESPLDPQRAAPTGTLTTLTSR